MFNSHVFRGLCLIAFSLVFLNIQTVSGQACNCVDYLYVNDPNLDITHKFTIDPDGTIGAEVGNPWLDTGVVTNAHGVVSDPAGNLYISQIDVTPTVLYKVSCEGDVIDPNIIPNWQRTLNMTTIGSTLYSIGRDPNGGPYMVFSYDLCTNTQIGSIELPDNGKAGWGITTGEDGELYFTQSFGGNTTEDHEIYTVTSDLSTITLVASIPNMPGYTTHGVTQDEFGNFYLAVTDNAATATTIYKIDPAGNVLSSIMDNTNDQVGYGGTWGIKYNPNTGKIYAGTRNSDCVSVIDAGGQSGTMTYEPGAGVGYVAGTYSKAVNIVTECCPISPNVVIDTVYCNLVPNDVIGLNDFVCDGIICGATWTPEPGNTGLSLNNCSQDVTVLSNGACGTYVLEDLNSTQCGSYSITVNMEIQDVIAPVIAGDQTICAGEDPVAFTVTTAASGSGALTYQWQKSTVDCTTGFVDIPGATSTTFDETAAVSQTTYYQLVASVPGGNCATGICSEVSNCLTLTVDPNVVASAFTTNASCFGSSDGTATANVSSGTPTYMYTWDDPAAQTTMVATGLSAGVYSVTIVDSNGCSAIVNTVTVGQPPQPECETITIVRN